MSFSQRRQTYLICLILVILQFVSIHTEEVCGNEDLKRITQIGLFDSKFWSSKSQDFEQCAKLCIRQKKCRSITYDTQSRLCELNAGTKSDTSTRSGTTLVYSEFDWWPSSLDKHCHSRPCDVSETCAPGTLHGESSGCSYSCQIFSRDVCPLPSWGVTNGRTVGSINSYTCENGTIGGGRATCLASKQWDKDISPTCKDVFGHSCNSNFDPCHLIKGKCSDDGQCDCGNADYNSTSKECYFDCGTPNVVAGATVHGSGNVRKYVCDDDPDAQHLYPVSGTGDGTITCDEDSLSWKPSGFKCGGLRLKQTHPKMVDIPNSGFLEMYANGEWRAVTYETWNWQNTKVACKKLFGFVYGGSYHKGWFEDENPNRLSDAYKLDNIGCDGNEDSLEECQDYESKNGDIDKEVALTCFSHDIFASGIVRLEPGSRSGAVIVNIGSAPEGGVCGDDWDDKATKVVCRTINSDWERDGECKSDCGLATSTLQPFKTNNIDCKGDEPHLFYCENKGWGTYTDCDLSKIVKVRCDN